MATKMNAATAKRVKALGINAKTEEEAREKLLEILTENGIDGMEEEDTDTILDIAESFVEESNVATGETEPENEPDEASEEDELAQEVEEETTEEEGDEFDKMDRTALKAYIKTNGLDVTVKKSMTDDDIRDLIRQAEADDEVAEEDEEEEVEEKPAKKAEKSVKKETEKKAEKPAKKAEKEEKKKPEGKRGTKLDPKNNEEDRKEYAPLKKLFPEDKFLYAWIASAGVTIKYKGQNSQRALVSIENCMKQADGSIKCNLYLLTLTKQTEILDKAEIDYQPCWSGAPMIKGTTLKEAIEIVGGLMEPIMATVQKIDKKLGDNRKKMEDNLDKTSKAKTEKKK